METNALTDQLTALTAEVKNKASQLHLDLDYDKKNLTFSCKIEDFIKAIKPSSTGESKGMLLSLSGEFDFEGPDGKIYTFSIQHPRGGGAWVSPKVISVKAPKPATEAAKAA